ncbi:chromogranin-A [Echeneis naucrates]|uniref:Chromogranin-A n=1 Tax=Echeneis naucrates TaxID=173247 RepID=A0A665WEY9_ECHNA|nr:chromogranin-A [Echeneis naucrates]
MIGRGLLVLTLLSNCVLSLPVTSRPLENEDVKVMKCVVEALADVLARPHPVPVSQECLVILKTDDRLVRILRHHNFLKELQEIALQGGQERAQLQSDAAAHDPTTHSQTTDGVADQSMLDALGGPGERSILSQTSRTEKGDREAEKDESHRGRESQEDNGFTEDVQVKRGNDDENPGSHVSESMEEWSEGKAEKREREEEESEEKRSNSVEGNMTKDNKGGASDEKRDALRHTSKEKKFDEAEEVEEEKEDEKDEKRAPIFPPKQGEEEGEEEQKKRWTKRGKGSPLKKKAKGQQGEVPHHSKEVTEDEEEKKKRSPEEKELQMIVRRAPEERRGMEEEGSASRKSEEPEIESLAAIESELENVAQKLHELRRG